MKSNWAKKSLLEGKELVATFVKEYSEEKYSNGVLFLIYQDQLFRSCTQEIYSDNLNYFDTGFDKIEENSFVDFESLELFLNKYSLSIELFKLAKNIKYFRQQ